MDKSTTMGLKITHGLIGSNEWWTSINNGDLLVNTLRGVVRGLWLGEYNSGGPSEFRAESEDGVQFQQFCEVEPDQAKSLYTLGRIVEVDVVEQFLKEGNFMGKETTQITLEIRLGSTAPGLVEPITPSYFGS